MAKRKNKLGTFSTKSKTVFQDDLRMKKLSKIQDKQKDNLKKSERELLNASQALQPKRNSYNKGGSFSNKNARIDAMQRPVQQSGPSIMDNFESAFNTSTKFSVASMIDNKSPTGVLSQKDVTSALGGFVSKVKGTQGVNAVDVQKVNNKITGLNVKKDFQAATFNFDPTKLMFETKGWNVDIPEEYIKVTDTHYKAPTKKFLDKYEYERDGKDRDKDKRYGSYNPVEVFLNDSGDKLSRVLKRGTYTKSYEREEDGDKRSYERDKDVFTKEIQDYFGTGLLKRKRAWDDYTIYEREEERGRDKSEEEEKRGIYLHSDLQYNPGGTKKSYQRWDDYVREEDIEERGKYDSDREEEGAVYLSRQDTYDDRGRLTRRQRFDDYTKEREREYGVEAEDEIERGTYLRTDEVFDNGKRVAKYRYDDYMSDFDKDRGVRMGVKTETGNYRDIGSEGYNTRNAERLEQYNPEDIVKAKSKKYEEEYSTGLRSITFYDPLTGKEVERTKFW